MYDNSELFRTDLALKLSSILPSDKIHDVLKLFDITSSDYDISKKSKEIILVEGIPEVVKHFIASKSIANCSRGTLEQYKYKLTAFFLDVKKPIDKITTNDIRLFLYKYKQLRNVSDHTIENTRRILNNFFEWLVDNEYLVRNPCVKIEHIKYQENERNPLTSYELETIRWECKSIREKALVDFLFSTGCRVSECSSVNLSDINWEERSVIIRHGKGDKRRIVFFNAESEFSLRKYLETRNDDNESLFVSLRAPFKRLSKRGIELEIKKIGERVKIEIFPHKLRHTFATEGLNGGLSLETLQALMGHANPRTTLIYAKHDALNLQREHKKVYS